MCNVTLLGVTSSEFCLNCDVLTQSKLSKEVINVVLEPGVLTETICVIIKLPYAKRCRAGLRTPDEFVGAS